MTIEKYPIGWYKNFWSKISKTPKCWIWNGHIKKPSKKGNALAYGCAWHNGRRISAHRLCWLLTHGNIPKGLSILHHCDIPLCVNPNHLYAGTLSDNAKDAIRRKRMFPPLSHSHARGEKHGSAKLDNIRAKEIIDLKDKNLNMCHVAKIYGVDPSAIRQIWIGKTWRHIPR